MPITPQISGQFVIRVAELYTDFNRAVMEYIDNSLDSAEAYYDAGSEHYKKPIKITVFIDKESQQIIIEDDCKGIENLNMLVQQIGDSSKKADFTTNGQFGFGIYSFMAGCEKLEFYSRYEGASGGYYIEIPKQAFEKDRLDEVNIDECRSHNQLDHQGTKVVLSEFSKSAWEDINPEKIKNEIEAHFEVLLKRKNLCIKINNEQAQPYNYDDIEGESWEGTISKVDYCSTKRSKSKKIVFESPIAVYLKMSEQQEVSRPPVFIVKGRRLNDVKSINCFKSNYGSKNMLWGHSQITGYIDLKDNFEPTIKRDDFKQSRAEKFKAFNQEMKEIEKIVYELFITVKNKEKADRTLSQLETKISDVMEQFAKDDHLSMKEMTLTQEVSDQGFSLEEGYGTKDRGSSKKTSKTRGIGIHDGSGVGPNFDKQGNEIFAGGENTKIKYGLQIKFTDTALIQSEKSKNEYIRSKLEESEYGAKTIVIFTRHELFVDRLKTTKKGELKITNSLIYYVACEIATHYKDELYGRNRNTPKNYAKEIFIDMFSLVYRIEAVLSPLVGSSADMLQSK